MIEKQPSFCEQCGTPLEPDLRFCEKCGAPVRPAPNVPRTTPASRPRRAAGCLIGLMALVALAAVVAGSYLVLRPAPVTEDTPAEDQPGEGRPIAAATTPTTAPTAVTIPTAMPTATPEPTQTATPPPTATATTAPASTGFIRILDVEAPAQVPAGMVFGVTVRYQWAFDGAGEVRIRGSFDNLDIPFLTRSVQSAGEASEYLDKFVLDQPGQHTLVVELYGSSGGGPELMDRRELTVVVTEAVPSATGTSEAPVPSGGQSRSDRDIYDDFSAETFSWCVGADEIAISGYEDGAYFMHTLQPQYRTLCFLPVTFFPTTAEFDAWVPQGFRGGTFGLACHFQSMDDFYSVEIDLGSGSLYVRQRAGGESYPLTDPEWIDLSYLKPTPTETNHVMVACDPDLITVWINYSLEAQVPLASLAEPGDMALFVKGWEDMEPEGYKVLFDNFVAWKPVQ